MKNTKHRQCKKRKRGASIAEAAAALSLFVPLIVMIVYVILEVSYAFLLKSSLSQAARQAARDLSIAYGVNPLVVSSRSMQDQMVFDKIRLANILNDSQQFDDPSFSIASDPATVSVTVRYTSNKYGLAPFPQPDPLGLGNTFQVVASSTYRLE